MEALEKGSVYTAVIDGYSSEGLGIARVNGAVVFVPHAVRGEEIDLRITKVMKTSCAGEIVKIHNPSPERMEPECPYAGKCGGCAYRHLTYPEELWAKRARVQDALTRIGGLDLTVEEILGAKNPEHYRNKSQYPVGADGSIGFFQARTHKVVPIRRCLIQTEAADRTAQAVGEWMRRYKISAYDETTGKGLVRHVCVRVNRKGESLCCVVVNGNKVPREPELAAYVTAAVPHTVGVLLNSNTRRGNVVLGDKYRTLFGRNYLMDTLCGLEFKLSMPSFYQVNRDQAEVLYGKALEFQHSWEAFAPEAQQLLRLLRRQLSDLAERMTGSQASRLQALRERVDALGRKRVLTDQLAYVQDKRMELLHLQQRLGDLANAEIARKQKTFTALAASLDAMSPLKVLGRGYAVARNEAGQVLKSSGETHIGERIHVTLGSGGLTAVVDHIEEARNGD